MAQPLARLHGRINHGLTPWRRRGLRHWATPLPQGIELWSEQWHSAEEWLASLEQALSAQSAVATRGGAFDRWDLQIRGGLLGGVRIRLAVEEHGAGKQLLRWRVWPVLSPADLGIMCTFGALTAGAALDHRWAAAALLGCFATIAAGWALQGCARAKAACRQALGKLGGKPI
jgi:hypothetical protein